MKLAQFTEPKLLVPRMLSLDQMGAIKELATRMQAVGRIDDAQAFYEAVLEREDLLGAPPELGIVFPHARGRGANSLSYAIGISAKGIPWGPNRESVAHTIFLLAVPLSETKSYLRLLSGLSRFGQDDHLRSLLLGCKQPEQMYELLNSVSAKGD